MKTMKHEFYTDGKAKVICVSHYAGKAVAGVAKCNIETDFFDLETGKKLAAARCDVKIMKKKLQRAISKSEQRYTEAVAAVKASKRADVNVADIMKNLNAAVTNLELLEKHVSE